MGKVVNIQKSGYQRIIRECTTIKDEATVYDLRDVLQVIVLLADEAEKKDKQELIELARKIDDARYELSQGNYDAVYELLRQASKDIASKVIDNKKGLPTYDQVIR